MCTIYSMDSELFLELSAVKQQTPLTKNRRAANGILNVLWWYSTPFIQSWWLCSSQVTIYKSFSELYVQGVPTSRVSNSTNSTSSNFSAIGIKFVLVELLCNKICTNGNWLGMYYPLVQISLVGSFPGPKICTKRGPPVP